jgi:hypothetical protein
MDNASKALIMAGAILIAVMLISLGVLLFSRGQQIAEDANVSIGALGKDAYNNRFLIYRGRNKSASDIRRLIHAVASHNHNSEEVGIYGEIDIGGIEDADDILSSHWYTVSDFDYDDNSGAIVSFTIEEQGSYIAN